MQKNYVSSFSYKPTRVLLYEYDTVNKKNIFYVLSKELSKYLPDLMCVDIGASYYPHPKCKIFLNAHNINWIAVEPNEKNLFYVQKWKWLCKITTI